METHSEPWRGVVGHQSPKWFPSEKADEIQMSNTQQWAWKRKKIIIWTLISIIKKMLDWTRQSNTGFEGKHWLGTGARMKTGNLRSGRKQLWAVASEEKKAYMMFSLALIPLWKWVSLRGQIPEARSSKHFSLISPFLYSSLLPSISSFQISMFSPGLSK